MGSKDSESKTAEAVIALFLDYLACEKAVAPNTRVAYAKDLEQFELFCRVKKIPLLEISLLHLRQYLASLKRQQLANRSLARKLSTLKQFYKFCLREGHILQDPSELLSITVKKRVLPQILTEKEVVRLIEAASGSTQSEIRDRALLELWYATGARISEMASLRIQDIDWKEGLVKFQGKGGKERLVPMHREALKWCQKYKSIRHGWLLESNLKEPEKFFLTRMGSGFTRQGIWKVLKKYVKRAGIEKRVWPHMIRHSFATHILQGGADLRAVQELLGHQSISTTEIYTHLDIENLKVMQLKYHPRG